MFRKPRKMIIAQMIREISKIKMEFAKEEVPLDSDLSQRLELNLDLISGELCSSSDLVIRRFQINLKNRIKAALVFIDGLADKKQIEWSILRPLMVDAEAVETGEADHPFDYIESKLITVGSINRGYYRSELITDLLAGSTVLLLDGFREALIINTPGWEKRSIDAPETEVIIKGPREGFVETLRTNTALLRRKVSHPNLVFETTIIGKKTRTYVCLAYLKGLANEEIVNEVKRRIGRVNTDSIISAGILEQFIEDAPLSVFSTIGYSERPDVVGAKILEGRIAILVDGTPIVMTVPFLFVENFQSPDDYNFRTVYATILRWVRYIAFSFSILSPAIYVALAAFHQELIPTQLLITMAQATQGASFPAVVEALGMGLIFEILREAGIRLPRPVGQAVSIVGALVIGEATVTAGLVGAPVVIVVALTAIASFVTPTLADEATILRFGLTIMAGFLGAFGILILLLVFLIHMVSLRSFGAPYLAPLAPANLRGMGQDVLMRAPIWAMLTRPEAITWKHSERQQDQMMPHPPNKRKNKDEK